MPFGKKFCFGEVDYFVSISDPKVCSNHLMLHVSQTAFYEISCVHRVCLCIRLSLSFLRIGSLFFFFFFDIVHDSWPWCLVTDEARFLKKIFPFGKISCFGEVDYFVSISDPKVCSNHLMLHVSQTASYEITCVHLTMRVFVCLSICLSLSFLRIGSLFFYFILFFFDIVHTADDDI